MDFTSDHRRLHSQLIISAFWSFVNMQIGAGGGFCRACLRWQKDAKSGLISFLFLRMRPNYILRSHLAEILMWARLPPTWLGWILWAFTAAVTFLFLLFPMRYSNTDPTSKPQANPVDPVAYSEVCPGVASSTTICATSASTYLFIGANNLISQCSLKISTKFQVVGGANSPVSVHVFMETQLNTLKCIWWACRIAKSSSCQYINVKFPLNRSRSVEIDPVKESGAPVSSRVAVHSLWLDEIWVMINSK